MPLHAELDLPFVTVSIFESDAHVVVSRCNGAAGGEETKTVAVPSSFFSVHDMSFDDRVLHISYEAHEMVLYTKTQRKRFEQVRADRGDCVQPDCRKQFLPRAT
jgi:hypothetical protein